jgi:hypothetical protein
MVMVVTIISMRWLIPRITLRKVDSAGKPLCLEEIDKAIGRDKINGFRVIGRSDTLIGCGMQLNHGLWCLRFGKGCHQGLAGLCDPTSTFL